MALDINSFHSKHELRLLAWYLLFFLIVKIKYDYFRASIKEQYKAKFMPGNTRLLLVLRLVFSKSLFSNLKSIIS